MKNTMKLLGLFASLLLPVAAFGVNETRLQYDKITQGASTASDKEFVFNIGAGASNPKIKGKSSTNKVQFCHAGDASCKDIGSGGGAGGGGIVLNANGGFEEGLGEWTASGGTATLITTLANVGFGLQSASWDASAASQTYSNTAVTVPSGLYGKVCTLSWYYKGGDSNYKAQVYDGTNVIAESSAFTAQTTFSARQVLYFTCPSSGNFLARFISSGDGAAIFLDNIQLGQEGVFEFATGPRATLRLDSANGWGGTNTAIRRFLTVTTNSGTDDWVYADSVANGMSITILTPGVYAATYTDQFSSSSGLGISLNYPTPITTGIGSSGVSSQYVLASSRSATTNVDHTTTWVGFLNAGDILRAHTDAGATTGSDTTHVKFQFVKVSN